ncbi:murein hydrolase activator EnvC family protein [Chitinophagaceae bacterium LWZ2-11]
MLKKALLFVISFCFVLTAIRAQQQPTREELQKQQQQLLKELDDLNNDLEATRKNKKAALGAYAVVQRKISARESLINSINKEIRTLDETIFQNERDVYRLKKELDTLKIQYAKSIVFAYKNRSSYEYLNFLFSAESFNDALKRVTYLKSYRQYRETQAETIVKTQALLQQKTIDFNNSKKDKGVVLVKQSEQLKVLEEDKKDQTIYVQQLKDQEKDLTAQIKKREKQRQELKRAVDVAIKRAIEEEKKKERDRLAKQKADDDEKRRIAAAKEKDAPAKTNGGSTTPAVKPTPTTAPKPTDKNYSVFESTEEGRQQTLNFENNKGRLPWPIDVGTVYIDFGRNQPVPGTKLHVDEDGILMKTKPGTKVKCVADGEVTSIFNLDEYQTVIVRHGRYFTLYNKLDDVSVEKGDKVKAGTVLGKAISNSDGEGEFEILVQTDKMAFQNPRIWLKHK